MMLLTTTLLLALATTASAQTGSTERQQIEKYLSSVYTLSDFSKLNDTQLFEFYDSLTFYYEGYPKTNQWNQKWPSGRVQSHPYAGTTCDCLHIDLAMCVKPPGNCQFWPLDTYLNLDYVKKFDLPGLPANSWFEGVTYPGEWAFPYSCQNTTLGRRVYAFHHRMWLYPATGTGAWFNTGNTAAAYNKVAWLLTYGKNSGLGSNVTEMMDTMAKMTCSDYQLPQRTHCNYTCPTQPDKVNPNYCCCHGHHGYNLGMQIKDAKSRLGFNTWNDALNGVAKMYLNGEYGQDSYSYPQGTFFGYLDILDRKIKDIQAYSHLESVQLIREPQHGGYHSNPDYAFEINLHTPYNHGYYRWHDWCNKYQSALGVLDPLFDFATYVKDGYVSSNVHTKRLDAWVGRPDFLKLFATN